MFNEPRARNTAMDGSCHFLLGSVTVAFFWRVSEAFVRLVPPFAFLPSQAVDAELVELVLLSSLADVVYLFG